MCHSSGVASPCSGTATDVDTDRGAMSGYPVAVTDLGQFDQPLLICGGAYGNLEALEAFFAAAAAEGVPPERIIHTGDAVAYCADPVAVSELLRQSGVHLIQGNVEESLAESAADCHCGFEKGSDCDTLADQWFTFADARIDQELRRWMAATPQQLTFRMGGLSARVVHGGVCAVNTFLHPASAAESFARELAACGEDVVLGGHSALPFTRRFAGRTWHNSGALGMPANDGTPRVWYSRLSPLPDGGIRFDHLPLSYDYRSARAKMRAARLPAAYAEALATGLWPSSADLPPEDRARTGVALDARSVMCEAVPV